MILFSGVVVPVSIVAICTGIVAVIIAGPWALAYILLYFLATLPGWPLGRVLFGRHPAGWVFGALAGIRADVLRIVGGDRAACPIRRSLCTRVGDSFGSDMVRLRIRPLPPSRSASARLAVAFGGGGRRDRPLIALPAWSTPDARTLVLLLLLVPAVFVFPVQESRRA